MERQGKRDKVKMKKKGEKEKVGSGPPGGDSEQKKSRSIRMERVEFKGNSRTVSWKKAPLTGYNAVAVQVSKSAALYTPIPLYHQPPMPLTLPLTLTPTSTPLPLTLPLPLT